MSSPTPTARRFASVVLTALAALAAATLVLADPTPDSSAEAAKTRTWTTRIGSTVYAEAGETKKEAFERVQQKYGGRLGVVRVFFPGLPNSWDQINATYGATPLAVSFKASPSDVLSGKYDDYLATWFAQAPTDYRTRWTYFHEPEDNAGAGDFSTADYRAAWQRIAALADATGNPRLRSTLILMCWTLDPKSGRDWRNYYPGSLVIDVLAFDCYNTGQRNGVYKDPANMLDPVVRLAQQEGKPWAITELGSLLIPGDDGTARAQWLSTVHAYAEANGAGFVTYFDSKVGGEFRLLDAPSTDAWKQAITSQFR